MTNLATAQAAFQRLVLGSNVASEIDLRHGARAPVADMLSIYRQAYLSRLTECLANDFPGLLALLGREKFDAMAADYIAKHPSRTPSVRWFGEYLPDHLAGLPGDPAAADMARFEWALAQAFDAPDDPVVVANDLAATPPEQWAELCFEFCRAVSAVPMSTSVPDVRQRLLGGDHPAIAPNLSPVMWLVWRQDLDVRFRPMSGDEAVAYAFIAEGGTFGGMCDLLSGELTAPETSLRAAQILRGWVDGGLISAIRIGNQPVV